MLLDGILTAPLVDSSGETLNMEGTDVTDFQNGSAVINWEHKNDTSDVIIGAIRYAKKIYKRSDCENKRQEMFYDMVGGKYIYILGELYDDEEHVGAVACAAMVRYYKKRNIKMNIGWSIEGATLERDGSYLKQAVARRVAFTLRPCLKAAAMGAPDEKEVAEFLNGMEKSSKIKTFEIDSSELILEDNSNTIVELSKAIADLNKTLEAGNYNVAPSQLTGGAALQVEDLQRTTKNKLKAIVRDWDRKRPLKEVIKASMPEVSDSYVDHFVDLAEDIALKKSKKPVSLLRIGKEHGHLAHDVNQEGLIDGLFMEPSNNPAKTFEPKHDEYTKTLFDLKNDKGQRVIVKRPELDEDSGADFAHNAMAYSHLAHNYFGLGKHVPKAAAFKHDKLNSQVYQGFKNAHWGAQEHVPNSKSLIEMRDDEIGKKLQPHYESGNLHKLMIMDHILGNSDRHSGNIMFDKEGNLHHIDHDMAFTHAPNVGGNYYQTDTVYAEQPVHPKANEWLNTLDEKTMGKHMMDLGLDTKKIKNSITAMKLYKKYANKGYNINKVSSLVDGELAAINAPPQGQVNGNA